MNVASRFRLLAPAIVLVALSACGGETRAPDPELRARVGAELAARADAVAVSLDSGDGCDAKERAQALQRDVAAAIDSGRVPAELQRELRRTSARLVAQIECVVAEPPPDEGDEAPPDEGDDDGDEETDEEGDAASCEALESRKAEIDAENEELKEQIEDEKERKEREKELREEKKAIEEELKACEEGE